MQIRKPTPTCSHFQAVEMPCASCQGRMRLAIIEPSNLKLELRTYHCALCEEFEVFLMQI